MQDATPHCTQPTGESVRGVASDGDSDQALPGTSDERSATSSGPPSRLTCRLSSTRAEAVLATGTHARRLSHRAGSDEQGRAELPTSPRWRNVWA
jgi:hypothetical protein